MSATVPSVIHFESAGVSVIVQTDEGRLPRLIYWGSGLGELSDDELAAFVTAVKPPIGHNPNDQVWNVSVLPEFEAGWIGRPGVQGSRAGKDWSPAFRSVDWAIVRGETEDGRRADALVCRARDDEAQLELVVEIELLSTGLLRARAALGNLAEEPFAVEALRLVLPVPTEAEELLDFTGRHIREFIPQRNPFPMGVHSREMRGGRTGLDAAHLLVAGAAGFGFRQGELWAAHVAFSGNQALYAERHYNGARVLGGGELLQSGEIRLGRGESYRSPWVYGAYAQGLDAMSERFHAHVRQRPGYPRTPRPVVVNSWEAVYFDHEVNVLNGIAEEAARIGAERFVLDDGWFGDRRDDTRGLGDWTVSPEAWPDGLHPLIEHVKSLGMDFGLWVEPEMVNRDSELARRHPEWLFAVGGRVGYPSRHQHVLDLTHPEAYAYIRDALAALLDEYDIAYLKWDHNRQLVEAGHTPDGTPAIHGQTLAVYRLMDELKAAHPGLEIESCASGAGRIDLGILDHVDRVWGSDTNDPVERQQIHRYLKLLVPPELIGAHIGASPSHTTGRVHGLDFRAETAIWCHLGVELDVRTVSADEREGLRRWIDFHTSHRALLHSGTVVNADHPDEAIWVSGIVATDRSAALFGVAALSRSVVWPPGKVRLPGLDPEGRYRVAMAGITAHPEHNVAPEWSAHGVTLSGAVLAESGVQLIPTFPESAYVVELTRVG